MGQKSRSKKNRSTSQPSLPKPQARQVGEVVPASLSGEPSASAVKQTVSKAAIIDIQTEYIRSDIVRILILLAAVAVMLAAMFFLGEETSYLRDGGRELSRILRLQ